MPGGPFLRNCRVPHDRPFPFSALWTSDPGAVGDDIGPADLRAAMQDSCDRHDDLLAEYCRMKLRALLWRWNRAAPRAQAHQVFCHIVARRQHSLDAGTYEPACFRRDPRIEAVAMQRLVQRLNEAHGHALTYKARERLV